MAGWLTSCVAVAALCGCGDDLDDGPPGARDLRLVSEVTSLDVVPGERAEVVFTLQDKQGRPRPGRLVEFALLQPEAAGADTGGASLLSPQETTDAQGRVSASFRAGAAGAFRLTASHSRSMDLTVPVSVLPSGTGRAVAMASPEAGLVLASLELRLYPGTSCSALAVTSAPPGEAELVQKLPVQGRWTLPALTMGRSHAILARGLDQSGLVIGFGCVDLDGSELLQSTPITVAVPLARVPPNLVGRFQLASEIAFAPELAEGARTAITAWSRFSGCPYDPVSVWLDCTLDALGNENAEEDPLDCRPAPDEGPVGQLLAARLGVSVANSDCRGAKDVGGQESLDVRVLTLLPPTSDPLMQTLPRLTGEMRGLFDRIRLGSTLEFISTGRARQLLASHTIASVGFAVGDAFASVTLLDRPGRFSRFVPATVDEDGSRVELGNHGFALRLGEAARAAFVSRALDARGLGASEGAFVERLFGSAELMQGVGEQRGCEALDALVCQDLGQDSGCLLAACELGLTTLAARLRVGFSELDGDDLDLFLEGGAAFADRTDDGTVGSLGSLVANRVGPGLWTGEVRSRAGTSTITGLWVGTRPPNM